MFSRFQLPCWSVSFQLLSFQRLRIVSNQRSVSVWSRPEIFDSNLDYFCRCSAFFLLSAKKMSASRKQIFSSSGVLLSKCSLLRASACRMWDLRSWQLVQLIVKHHQSSNTSGYSSWCCFQYLPSWRKEVLQGFVIFEILHLSKKHFSRASTNTIAKSSSSMLE